MGKGHSFKPARLSNSNHFLASRTNSSRGTSASVSIYFIYTGGTIPTRRRLAFINIDSAVRTSKARGAFTSKPVHSINTDPSIVTWMRVAVIGVLRACASFPSFLADAREGIPAANTRSTIHARVQNTAAVFSSVASTSYPLWRTGAAECVPIIIARPTITASVCITLVFT